MSDTTRTPMEEVGERLAEAAPAKSIPFLIGLEHYRSMMSDYRNRTRDDHKLNTKLLTEQAGLDMEPAEPEEMGDIMVSGDSTKTENHYHYSSPPAAGKEAPSIARKLLPVALAAATGFGGMWLWQNLQCTWPGVPDTAYEVRFYNSDGELIQIPRHGGTQHTD